jgi:hypothetical protein
MEKHYDCVWHLKASMMAENSTAMRRRRGPGKPFRPGHSGNPTGKPKGTRHRATMIAEQLLDGEAESLTRTVIEKAKQGDMIALRLCLDRIVPPRRDRPVHFTVPELKSAADAGRAVAAIALAVSHGDLGVSEAAELSKLIENFVRAIEATDLEKRLLALEQRLK